MPHGSSDELRSISELSASSRLVGSVGKGWKSEDGSMYDDASVAFKQRKRAYIPPQIARREQRNVLISRILVALVLIASIVGAAFGTFRFVKKEEDDDFDDEFAVYSEEVLLVTAQNIQKLFLALESFAAGIALEAAATNSSWPFVTVNDWSLRTKNLKNLIGDQNAESFFAPLVKESEAMEWQPYSVEHAPIWYQQSVHREGLPSSSAQQLSEKTIHTIHYYDEDSTLNIFQSGTVLPVWQYYPLSQNVDVSLLDANVHSFDALYTNIDLLASPRIKNLFQFTNATSKPSISSFEVSGNTARSLILQPILNPSNNEKEENEILGVVGLSMDWGNFIKDILPAGIGKFMLVLRMKCDDTEMGVLTYRINGPNAKFLGDMDAHDDEFDYIEARSTLFDRGVDASTIPGVGCSQKITLHFYPTQEYENRFHRGKSEVYTGVVVSVFLFTTLVFLIYDFFVNQRQKKVMKRIMTQDRIVADVFPSAVRERLYEDEDHELEEQDTTDDLPRTSSQAFDDDELNVFGPAPLADLFPNTTIVFADIVGFTAWSSAREPQQVFRLLESLYTAFDKIAYRHGVFKIETVGDCYVAVAGLPEPNKRHAICVARFARDIVWKMKEITHRLEVSLGPETSELDLRVGIHSGQVTAGVLRGERSRFQLFGDTMNTAARMEHTGEPNCIQISQVTADLLSSDGYSRLIEPRRTTIFVKGKGEMQTYWLSIRRGKKERDQRLLTAVSEQDEQSITSSTSDSPSDDGIVEYTPRGMSKQERLIEWHVEVLASLLQQIMAARFDAAEASEALQDVEESISNGQDVLDEVVTIINLKRFDAKHLKKRPSPASIDIGEKTKNELRNYVANIAELYNDNPFHNFEHASHVTASVTKLLRRIVNVDEGKVFGGVKDARGDQVNLVDLAGHSYGITSDPLTQFAVVFSAIIHDADHPGVPNSQLVVEKTKSALRYKKSIAEQNSVDLAWSMLMRDEFANLRACIYQNEEGLKRFRQLVVNSVMATDIVDKELQELRRGRWDLAFARTGEPEDEIQDDRKATIVIEHLIQASDVAHTMQHWHIYKAWNERFFMECYGAYKMGRANVDPSVNWYRGEIGFFDYYVIPLAMKLQECGVFGVASHEYLNYAMANRDEWVREGEEIVKTFIEKYEKVYGDQTFFDGDDGDDTASSC